MFNFHLFNRETTVMTIRPNNTKDGIDTAEENNLIWIVISCAVSQLLWIPIAVCSYKLYKRSKKPVFKINLQTS